MGSNSGRRASLRIDGGDGVFFAGQADVERRWPRTVGQRVSEVATEWRALMLYYKVRSRAVYPAAEAHDDCTVAVIEIESRLALRSP